MNGRTMAALAATALAGAVLAGLAVADAFPTPEVYASPIAHSYAPPPAASNPFAGVPQVAEAQEPSPALAGQQDTPVRELQQAAAPLATSESRRSAPTDTQVATGQQGTPSVGNPVGTTVVETVTTGADDTGAAAEEVLTDDPATDTGQVDEPVVDNTATVGDTETETDTDTGTTENDTATEEITP